MELIVRKVGTVVTKDAARFAPEQCQPPDCRFIHRSCLPHRVLVEGAILRYDRAFEGRNSLRNVLQTRSTSEDQLELLLIAGDLRNFGYDSTIFLGHFDRIVNRA